MFKLDAQFNELVLKTLQEELPKLEGKELDKLQEVNQLAMNEINKEVNRRKKELS